jgi:hypothetical protein
MTDIFTLIDDYLIGEQKQASGGGYPKVTVEELRDLSRVIEGMIHYKYGRDADGDLPLYAILVDRTRERHPYLSIPHHSQQKIGDFTIEHFSDMMRLAATNLAIAENDIRLTSDLFNMWTGEVQ